MPPRPFTFGRNLPLPRFKPSTAQALVDVILGKLKSSDAGFDPGKREVQRHPPLVRRKFPPGFRGLAHDRSPSSATTLPAAGCAVSSSARRVTASETSPM